MSSNHSENNKQAKVILQIRDHHILIQKDNVELLNYWLNKILFHIQNETDVPFQFVDKFLELLTDTELHADNGLKVEADEIAKKVYSKLSKIKEYDFKWKQRQEMIEGKVLTNETTSEDIYFACTYEFLLYKNSLPEHKLIYKEDVLFYIYELLSTWGKDQLIEEYKESFTDYRTRVISGWICISLGYPLTNRLKFNNKDVDKYCLRILNSINKKGA